MSINSYQNDIASRGSSARIFIQQPSDKATHVHAWVAIGEGWAGLCQDSFKQLVFILDAIVGRHSIHHFNDGNAKRPHIDGFIVVLLTNDFWSHPLCSAKAVAVTTVRPSCKAKISYRVQMKMI